jgi:hypothetical protein
MISRVREIVCEKAVQEAKFNAFEKKVKIKRDVGR